MIGRTVAADDFRRSRRDRARLAAAVVVAVNLAVAGFFFAAPRVSERLDPRLIRPEAGHAWTTAEPGRTLGFPYRLRWDSEAASRASDAIVLEDGNPLGPPHSLHDEIRTLGRGRYSFWRGTLYFSTANNSDPRADGHVYAVRFDAALSRPLIWAVVLLDGVALFVFRRRIALAAARYGRAAAALLLAGLLLRVAMAAIGLMPPLFAGSGSLLDMAFVRALVLHLGLGIALTAAIFACGGGIVRLFRRDQPPLADLLLCAFLPGTLVIAAAAALAVAIPHGDEPALALLAAALLPFYGYRPERAVLTRAAAVAGLALPAAAMLAAVMSFAWHGPTATLAGGPLGDMTTYAGWANTLAGHIAPFRNYGVEGGAVGYGDQLPPLLMAAMLRYRWFDPYLFISASLVAMLALSLAVMFALYDLALGPRDARPRDGRASRWIITGLIVGAPITPSWIAASPPVAFLVPLVISTVYLWRSAQGGRSRLVAGTATAVVGSAISKVVAFVVLVPLLLPDLWAQIRLRLDRRALVVASLPLALAAIYAALLLRTYLPEYLGIGVFGPLSWNWLVRLHQTPIGWAALAVAYDLGAVLLALAAIRLGPTGVAFAAVLGVASYLAMQFLFQAALMTVMLLAALMLVEMPERLARARVPLAAAAALVAPYPPLFDPGGLIIGIPWVLSVAFLVQIALTPPGRAPRWQREVAALVAVLLVALLPAVGVGAVAAGPPADRLIFTREMRDIWLAVRRDTPPDALIFTDQTGATESRTGGWNDYALMARRQFFLVSWDEDPLRWHPAARARLLQRNERVLDGALRPSALPLSRRYDGYYAVILNTRRPPPGALPIYRNSRYGLFRLRD